MWKKIEDFDYSVNEYGEVRSEKRLINDSVGHSYYLQERILKTCYTSNGYKIVYLRKNGRTYPKYVHLLVAVSFVKNHDPEFNIIVNHKDGDKKNCYYSNLEWCTYSENNQHAYDNGLKGRGENFYNSKLTENEVKQIRTLYNNGCNLEQLSKEFYVSRATIRDVVLFKTWKYVI